MSALHHEVLAVLGCLNGPRSTWIVCVHVAARRSVMATAIFRSVARALANLRRLGLAVSQPQDEQLQHLWRGHLWSIP